MSKTCQLQTPNNLLKSFAGESQARNRYTFFASTARSEGYMQIAAIFAETADQEKEHAERFFKLLRGGEDEITATFPAGVLRSKLRCRPFMIIVVSGIAFFNASCNTSAP